MPGTPSRHLPVAATSASNGAVATSIGERARTSSSHRRSAPCRAARRPARCRRDRFSIPAPVSQCTCATCVIDGSAASAASTIARGRRLVLGHRQIDDARGRGTCRCLTMRCAVGAVVRHQHLAVARHERCRSPPRPRTCRCPAAARRCTSLAAADDIDQVAPQARRDRVERGIPRAPVAQHRLLGGERSRQRAGGEQDRIVADNHRGLLCTYCSAVLRQACVRRISHHSIANSTPVTTAEVDDDQRRHRGGRADRTRFVQLQDRDRRERASSANTGTRPPRSSSSR